MPTSEAARLRRTLGSRGSRSIASSRTPMLHWVPAGSTNQELYATATAAEPLATQSRLADAAAGLGGIWLGEHRSDDVAGGVRALQEHALEAVTPVDTGQGPAPQGPSCRRSVLPSREVAELERLLDEVQRVWHRKNCAPRRCRS